MGSIVVETMYRFDMVELFESEGNHCTTNKSGLQTIESAYLMTLAFTSIMSIFIIERIDDKKGTVSIIPLVLTGIISIFYWRQECKIYALVQFVPCVVIPIMAILLPPMYTHSDYWLWAAAFYLLAKIEAEDKPIYKWTSHVVNEHTLKHLFAAMVPLFLTLMLSKRRIAPERSASI
ncbi:PREDICTED: uncharacterized protein LOC104608144 [Nelumbo nucifera]|uniref:Uncharacterized protein LOC104608144 n=1 Tax=Nelumbo nucifera TaxID=4432 RepID=A0A1U8AZW8_NELNU|nr:PREDICTED: uncharacterized protein LOC104608144 [Nelumbo nucifera]